MKNAKFYKWFNISLFVFWLFLFVFEIVKVCIWGSHRQLVSSDYQLIAGGGEQVLLFGIWLIFSLLYETKGKFRKTTFTFYIIWSLLFCQLIYQKAEIFSRLFFATEYYTPVFIDKFTSLFELCYVCIFTVVFIGYFVFLLCKKHFKKLS